MEYINNRGKYSFYTFDKNDIFVSEDNKDEINEKIETNEISSEDYFEIYVLDNGKIIEEYCPGNGECNLYRVVDDDRYELLFQKECSKQKDGDEDIQIYTKDKVFTIISENGSINKIAYMTIGAFEYMVYNIEDEKLTDKFAEEHTYMLVYNGNVVCDAYDRNKVEAIRDLYIRYKMASIVIPSRIIVDEMYEDVKEFANGKEIDKEKFEKNLEELQMFKDFCPSSFNALSSFVNNFEKANVDNVLKTTNENLKNMGNLIDMYLADELEEKDDRGIEK